jgi:hypothetical protein
MNTKEYLDKQLKMQMRVQQKAVEMALHDAGGGSIIEDETINFKKEIKSLKIRLASALRQRDEWAVKYAKLKEIEKDWKILEKNTCSVVGHEL